jgi:hypothetical protein
MQQLRRVLRLIFEPRKVFSRSVENALRWLVDTFLSRSTRWRGQSCDDARITLLTVDYQVTDHVLRLAASFRRHVEPLGEVVVVQNGPRRNNKVLRAHGIRVVGFGRNLRHGPALDWGMRKVTSKYVLICDPDTFILNDRFRDEILERLDVFGVAGIVVSGEPKHRYYHPICTALATRVWKTSSWSFRDHLDSAELPNDVGYQLTRHLGGLEPDAIIPISRRGYAGQVIAECFTHTWAMSRAQRLTGALAVDGRPVDANRSWQDEWVAWVDRIAAGLDDVEGFPSWWPDEQSRRVAAAEVAGLPDGAGAEAIVVP